jgi:HEAT repeat protein
VVALGRLGDLEPAQRILEKHLADGSVVPLAVAAVRALQEATDAPTAAALLRRALGSPDGSVQAAAARALATRTDPESRAAVLDFLQKLPANERAHVLPDAPEEPAVTGEPEDDAE